MILRSLFYRPKQTQAIHVDYNSLRLIRPDARYFSSFRDSYREYRAHKVEDFGYYKVDTFRDFNRFLTMSDEMRRGVNLSASSVQTSMFWLVDGQHYLGSGSLRHYLNDYLRTFGGHIGYSIRPAAWGQGLGTLQLHLLLLEAKKIGLTRARLTCFEHNAASQRVMEKNGAQRIDRVVNRISGKDRPTFIYEIDLTDF